MTSLPEQLREKINKSREPIQELPIASKEDILIQMVNIIQGHYEDMKLLVHQHAKMSADLINLQYNQPTNYDPIQGNSMPDEDMDTDLLGGEIGA